MSTYEGAPRTARSLWTVADRANAFLISVYRWMCVGVTVTAITAGVVAESPAATRMVMQPVTFWALMIAQLVIVVVLSARVQQLSPGPASVLFVSYSAMTGASLSTILLVFTGASVATTFIVAATMFGALAVY